MTLVFLITCFVITKFFFFGKLALPSIQWKVLRPHEIILLGEQEYIGRLGAGDEIFSDGMRGTVILGLVLGRGGFGFDFGRILIC